MKYDQTKLSGNKRFFADLLVTAVMLSFVALITLIFHFLIEPSLGKKQTVAIFVFLFAAPSAIGGAFLGKLIAYKYFK